MKNSKNTTNRIGKLIMIGVAIIAIAAITGCSSLASKTADNSSKTDTKQVVSLEKQKIDLEGVNNARQLGGYIGADGKKIKENVLLRTGALSNISDSAIAELTDKYHLKNIVDFRMDYEKKPAPDKEISGVNNTWISVFDLDMKDESVQNMMKNMQALKDDKIGQTIEYAKLPSSKTLYEDILMSETGQNGYAQFFDILANQEDGAILWHCTHGKDRAGIASALVLYALGVDEETIIEDFELSNEVYKQEIEYIAEEAKKRGCDETVVENAKILVGVSRERFTAAFDKVKAEYGSVDDYIKNQLKVSDEKLKKIRDIYLEK